MKAEKIVKLELKNPILRCIRKNFRDVVELAVRQESSRLFAISDEFRKEGRSSTNSVEKERLELEERKFFKNGSRLRKLLSKSIVQCSSDGGCVSLLKATKHGRYPKNVPTNLDMVWMPSFKSWYCTLCSEYLIEGDRLLREEKHPDYMRQLNNLGLT